jgi:hypothetical protein
MEPAKLRENNQELACSDNETTATDFLITNLSD